MIPGAVSSNVMDLITGGISFLLTVMVLSYLIGDNFAFRLAIHLFIGVSAGYAAAVAWHQVLKARLILPLATANLGDRLLLIIPLVLGLLLVFKLSPRTASLGTPSMAFLVGVGTAVAVGGSVLGTLLPQTWKSMHVLDLSSAGDFWLERLLEGTIMLIGTVTTLAFFHFGARNTPDGPQRRALVRGMSWVGQLFIAVTFGVLFSGIFLATMTAFIERINFILKFLSSL